MTTVLFDIDETIYSNHSFPSNIDSIKKVMKELEDNYLKDFYTFIKEICIVINRSRNLISYLVILITLVIFPVKKD